MKSKTKVVTICLCMIASFQFISCKKDSTNVSSVNKANNIQNAIADSTGDSSLLRGLVAWYPFNGDVRDHSGHKNHVVFNNAIPAIGKNGAANTAYQFDGSSSYMMVNDSKSLNPARITLYAVVKIKGFNQGTCHANRIINKEIYDGENGRYLLGYDDQAYYNYEGCFEPVQPKFERLYGNYGDGASASYAADTASYLKTNVWYNLAYVYNGIQSKLYVNGRLISTINLQTSFNPNTQPLLFGQTGNSQYPYWFNGKIDEIRIYNRALNAAEIQKLSN